MDYGRALRTIRAAKGMTQKGLADAAGVDPSFVSMIENGTREPSVKKLKLLTDALGVPSVLFTFFASDQPDLQSISEGQAKEMGDHMLSILMDFQEKDELVS